MSENKPKKRLDHLRERIDKHGFDGLTPSERAEFALIWFYCETSNGGMDQFFFNNSGQLASEALHGFEMTGAAITACIFRRAMSVFPGGVVPPELKARREFLAMS